MNHLKYENTHYEEALSYVEKYTKTKEDGYYTVDLISKSDQVQVQQNNTIIALLTSIHYRITQLESRLLKLEQISTPSDTTTWKTALQSITKDLEKISVGKPVKNRPQTYSFLTHTVDKQSTTPSSSQ